MRLLLMTTILFLTTSFAFAQNNRPTTAPDAKTEQELLAFEKELNEAFDKQDKVSLERLLADGFSFIHSTGGLETRSEYINNASGGRLARQRAEVELFLEPLRIYEGNTAIRVSRRTMRFKGNDEENRGRHIAVYVKINGRWQVVSSQSTKLPNRPKAFAVDAKIFNECTGQYEIGGGRTLTVAKEGNTLTGEVTFRPKFELIPKSETAFVRFSEENDYGDDQITFIRDASGKITHATLSGGGREVWRAKKVR